MLRWGVVGVGIAGGARIRAMRADPRAEPVIGWRGDPAAAGLPVAESLEALLEAVDAVAICAPDTEHPALVEAALRAGRHVLCEYPLAGSEAEARRLMALATQEGRVLHVEHIELLTPAARWIGAFARERELVDGSLRSKSSPRTRVFSVAHANLARLHRLVDAVGLPGRVVVEDRSERDLAAAMVYDAVGQGVELLFTQAPETRRSMELTLRFSRGNVMEIGGAVLADGAMVSLPTQERGLFEQDQLAASARILDGAEPYVSDARLLQVLGLADRLMSTPGAHGPGRIPGMRPAR